MLYTYMCMYIYIYNFIDILYIYIHLAYLSVSLYPLSNLISCNLIRSNPIPSNLYKELFMITHRIPKRGSQKLGIPFSRRLTLW